VEVSLQFGMKAWIILHLHQRTELIENDDLHVRMKTQALVSGNGQAPELGQNITLPITSKALTKSFY
jgi:hypothetical protein